MKPHPKSKLQSIINSLFCLILLTGLLGAGTQTAQAEALSPEAAPQNTIQGLVTLPDGTTPVAGALVLATNGVTFAKSAPTGVTGAYSLQVTQGDWQVSLLAPEAAGESAGWIYTGDPQLAHFAGNPDPSAASALLAIQVTPATATLQGRLTSPDGSPFTAPNRAWVQAANQEGLGNKVQVAADGAFIIHLLPGSVSIHIVLENPLWAPRPELSGSEWLVGEGETVTIDPALLQLVLRQAAISGHVRDTGGNSISGIPVRAWRLDGSESAQAVSDADGAYSLAVVNGVWEVRAVPEVDAQYGVPPAYYVPAEPPQRVTLVNPTGTARVELSVAAADVTINGEVYDAAGTTPIPDLKGRVWGTYSLDGDPSWIQLGPGAPIRASKFTLRLSSAIATHYRIHAFFPDWQGYTGIAKEPVTVTPGQTIDGFKLLVAPNNSSISGHFLDHATGQPETGIPGIVYAASSSGAFARDKVNPLTGYYEMQVASTGTAGFGGSFWWLHGFVDPTTGYAIQWPRSQKVFLPASGADVTANFTVAAIDGTLIGIVTDWQGTPVAGARVSAVEQQAPAGLAFRRWTLTDAAGRYRMRVTAGTYKVSADYRNWIAPVPAVVAVGSGSTVHADLQFRKIDAAISGKVSYAGSPHEATIRAYSDSGAHVVGLAGFNGNYVLGVNAGETWHVQAVSEQDGAFLKSARASVTTVKGSNPGVDLVLENAGRLPEAVAFSFDAADEQLFTLSNGAQVSIPASAMADAGVVTLVARPLVDLADDGGAQPVSFGYRLLAFDQSHMPVVRFNAPVTLVMPFIPEQLSTLGVTPEQLIPSYWDTASGSWKPAPHFSVTVLPDGSGSLNLEVEHFTDYALLAGQPSHSVFIPVAAR